MRFIIGKFCFWRKLTDNKYKYVAVDLFSLILHILKGDDIFVRKLHVCKLHIRHCFVFKLITTGYSHTCSVTVLKINISCD